MMDSEVVADHVVRLARTSDEGGFLLARVLTSQLMADPIDTSAPGWEHSLAMSVEAALARDLGRVTEPSPSGVPGPLAAQELLTALAWSYGTGMPDDVWVAVARALSRSGAKYEQGDVYWALTVVGRYVISGRGGNRAVYRLSHERLVQYLKPTRPPGRQLDRDPDAVAVANAMKELFDDLVEAGESPEDHYYLWMFAWLHFADAGQPGTELLQSIVGTRPLFAEDLVVALRTLAARLSAEGRPGDAVEPATKAASLLRRLTEADPGYRREFANALGDLAVAFSKVGRLSDAVGPSEEATAIMTAVSDEEDGARGDLGRLFTNLAAHYGEAGRWSEAIAPAEQAAAIYRELVANDAGHTSSLAGSLNNLSACYASVGRWQDALAPAEEAVTILRQLAAEQPRFAHDLASSMGTLSTLYADLGHPVEATALAEEATALYRQLAAAQPAEEAGLALALNNLSLRYNDVDRYSDSVLASEESVARYRQLAVDNPAILAGLARALLTRGVSLGAVGGWAEAVGPVEEAVEIYQRLAAEHDAYLVDLAGALSTLGSRYDQIGRWADAVAPTEAAVVIYRRLPANLADVADFAGALTNLGIRYSRVGRSLDAVAPSREAVDMYRLLASENPAFLPELAMSLANLGIGYATAKWQQEAIAQFEEAVRVCRELADHDPRSRRFLASALSQLCANYAEAGRFTEAIDLGNEAVATFRELVPTNPGLVPYLAGTLQNLASSYAELSRYEEAVASATDSLAMYRVLEASNPAFAPEMAKATFNFGMLARQLGRLDEAIAFGEEALARYRDLTAQVSAYIDDLASALVTLNVAYADAGQPAEGDTAWQRCLDAVAPETRAELLLRRATTRASAAESVDDILLAAELRRADRGEFYRVVARLCRASDAAEFDQAWLERTGEQPAWLTLDLAYAQLVANWVYTRSFAEAAAFAAEHGGALLAGQLDVVLDDIEAIIGNPEAVAIERQIAAAARETGFAEAYRPYVAAERLQAFLSGDAAQQVQALLEDRTGLLDAFSTVGPVDDDTPSAIVGAALLDLAMEGLDERAIGALAPDGDPAAFCDELVQAGNGTAVLAFSQLMAADVADSASVAQTLAHGAVGLVLADEAERATDLLREARRLDADAVVRLLPTFMTWTAIHPNLATLAPVFTEPVEPAPSAEATRAEAGEE